MIQKSYTTMLLQDSNSKKADPKKLTQKVSHKMTHGSNDPCPKVFGYGGGGGGAKRKSLQNLVITIYKYSSRKFDLKNLFSRPPVRQSFPRIKIYWVREK